MADKKKEYILKRLKEKIIEFNLPEQIDKIPLSGDFTDVTYNDETVDIVDPLAEFYLCKKHLIYFLEKYCYFIDAANKKISGLKPFNFQKEKVIPAFLHNRFVITRKSRQTGLSVLSGLYALWLVNFNVAQEVVIISKERKSAQEFKAKAMVTYDRLPGFLKTKATKDGQNMTSLRLINNSKIEVKAQSEDAGRGSTARLLILDEAAFMPYAEEIWASAYPSLSVSKGQCFVISTSNGVGNWYHQTWVDAENGLNDFLPIYIPWWMFPGRDNFWLEKIEKKEVPWLESQLEEQKIEELKKTYLKDKLENKAHEPYFKSIVDAFIQKTEEEQLSYNGPKENMP